MKREKTFDCVGMKNAAQARLRQAHQGLSDEEIARRRRQWLETSDDPLARWWRSLGAGGEPTGKEHRAK